LPALVLLRKPLFGLAKRRIPGTLDEIKTENMWEKAPSPCGAIEKILLKNN
jgi:hypothetical protein